MNNQTFRSDSLESQLQAISMSYVEKSDLSEFFTNLSTLDKYHISKTIPFLQTYSTWIKEHPNH
jgi:hypothetical protein